MAARVAIEQASTFGWSATLKSPTGSSDEHVWHLGSLKEVQKKFSPRPDHVAVTAGELLGRK
jgi:hypothetical protein